MQEPIQSIDPVAAANSAGGQSHPAWPWRQRLYNLLFSEPHPGSSARALRLVLCGSAVLSIILCGLDIARGVSNQSPDPLLFALHVLTTAIFSTDFLARLYVSPDHPGSRGAFAARLACLRRPEMLLEALTLAPFFIGFWMPLALDLRFLRSVRLLQLIPSRRLARARSSIQDLLSHAWPLTLAAGLGLLATAITLYGTLQAMISSAAWGPAAAASETGVAGAGLAAWSTPLAVTLVFTVLLLLVLFSGLLLAQQRDGPITRQRSDGAESLQPAHPQSVHPMALQAVNPMQVLGKPEQALAHFDVLLAQMRYIGVLTDHGQLESLAREGRISSADYAVWRHIQGYPLHPLQGGYGAQWRVRYSQPLYKLFTHASTQRLDC
jgi:hypothetical protein